MKEGKYMLKEGTMVYFLMNGYVMSGQIMNVEVENLFFANNL